MSIVDPKDIYHRIHGPEGHTTSAAPIVLLHGLMGFAANWGKVWPELHLHRRVLVLDQRGHGKSPKPITGYSPTDYAHDLRGLLDHLGWEKAHILGHSMGGRVALRFCSLYPERGQSLTLEDSGTDSRPERVLWIRDLLASIPTPFRDREEAKRFFADRFKHDPMTGGFLHMNLEPKSDGGLDWRFYAPGMIETVQTGRATDANSEFTNLKLPILIVRGSKSEEFPQLEADQMARTQYRASLATIEGASHFVHAEKPQEFNSALTNFLQKIERK